MFTNANGLATQVTTNILDDGSGGGGCKDLCWILSTPLTSESWLTYDTNPRHTRFDNMAGERESKHVQHHDKLVQLLPTY